MTLPLMDSDPTVPATPAVAGPLTLDSTVHDAWLHAMDTGAPVVVLVRGTRPAALVSRDALERALVAGDAGAPVGRVADHVVVPVDRTADALATLRRFTAAAWAWLRGGRAR